MATLVRAGVGLLLAGTTAALLTTAGGITYTAWRDGGTAGAAAKTPKVKAYTVEVDTLTAASVTPRIEVYGHTTSGRVLELRAALAGQIVELSPVMRDGGMVAAGDPLYRIDPARFETALAMAEIDVAQAKAGVTEAASALELARLEAAAAEDQLAIRDQSLARQKGLKDRGVATEADVEGAVLARAAAQQTLVNRRQVVAGAEARLAQSDITLARSLIQRDDATKALEDTKITAPFAGVLASVTVVQGRLVTANEQLAILLDPTDMEVVFRVTPTQYARLLNGAGDLRKTEAVIGIQQGRKVIEVAATLDRVGAETDATTVGRLVYAKMVEADPTVVRPGDFVTVSIPERPMDGVAEIPASALTADGRLLVLDDQNRLEEVQASMLRRQGDRVIVGDVPFGASYVTARAVQLNAGITVTPISATEAEARAVAALPEVAAEPDGVEIDDTKRAAIIAFIEGSEQMKPEMREKFLEEMRRPLVPAATVEKLEAKMAEGQ